MSTCPDSDLYSAYVDGEVPSPWKEKLEAHMAACPTCQKRAGKYEKLHRIIHDGNPVMSGEKLELSFARLSQRRAALLETADCAPAGLRPPLHFPTWTKESVRIPIPALAAMMLAAVFLPAYFALKANIKGAGNAPEYATVMPELSATNTNFSQKLQAMTVSNPVYSPDMPDYSTPANLLTSNKQHIFTMVNIARQFATDKDLFTNAEIIIIKLPDLTRFSNTGEQFITNDEPLQKAVGFYK